MAFGNRVERLGISEIRHVLNDSDLNMAARKSKLLGQKLAELFKKAANGMVNMELLFPIIKQLCSNILYMDEFSRKKMVVPLVPSAEYCEEHRIIMNECWKRGGIPNKNLAAELIAYMDQLGLDVDWDSLEMRPLLRNFFLGRMETYRIQKERIQGNYQNGFDGPFPDGSFSPIFPPTDYAPQMPSGMDELKNPLDALGVETSPETPPEISPEERTEEEEKTTFSIAIDSYIREKKIFKKLDVKSESVMRSHLLLLQEIFGDIEVAAVARENILNIMENILPQYPKNRNKKYPGQNLSTVLAMEEAEKISKKTQKSYFDDWKTFFKWSVTCRCIQFSPMEGLTLEGNSLPKDQQKKKFSSDDLTLIFKKIAELPEQRRFFSELYTFRYWIPVLALYQGMRLNEICQLHLKDIFTIGGIPCLRVTVDEEKSQKTKNNQSRRIVPIHSTLLKLGFLQYCLDVAALPNRSNDQLFQKLSLTVSGYQRKMDWFNRFIREFIPDKRKSFHSFRHNFDTCLMNRESNVFLVQCLGGYKREGEVGERYSVPEIPRLKQTLEKLSYDFDIFAALRKGPLSDDQIAEQINQTRLPKAIVREKVELVNNFTALRIRRLGKKRV